jgi:glycolate oxidase
VRALTIEGDAIELGSEALDRPGYDLLAVITGSEGCSPSRSRSR